MRLPLRLRLCFFYFNTLRLLFCVLPRARRHVFGAWGLCADEPTDDCTLRQGLLKKGDALGVANYLHRGEGGHTHTGNGYLQDKQRARQLARPTHLQCGGAPCVLTANSPTRRGCASERCLVQSSTPSLSLGLCVHEFFDDVIKATRSRSGGSGSTSARSTRSTKKCSPTSSTRTASPAKPSRR
jgi:hypothetical protein